MPCLRHRPAHFAPASCSPRMPMICSSVNRIRFIVRPQVGPDSNRRWRKNPVAGQISSRSAKVRLRPAGERDEAANRVRGMPPELRNHRTPTGVETPECTAASSLMTPPRSPARADTGSHAAIPEAARASATSYAWTSLIVAVLSESTPPELGRCDNRLKPPCTVPMNIRKSFAGMRSAYR